MCRDGVGPTHLARGFGPFEVRPCSDDRGLKQFGAFSEPLPPGSESSAARRLEADDEMAYVPSGMARAREGIGTADLAPGDAATFPVERSIGHDLSDPFADDAVYLVIGTCAREGFARLAEEDAIPRRSGSDRLRTDISGPDIDR